MLDQISAAILGITPSAVPLPGVEFPTPRKNSATRVLVVDDEQLVRWSIAETLRVGGCEILEASDAQSALALVAGADTPPDAVFLDLKLPDSDDLSLLVLVRHLLSKAPIILMTAFGTPELCAEARRLGAFTVLDKPFDLDDLEGLVVRALASPQPN
jgi:two-component system, NtrC family, response regulator AtoC